MLRFGFSQVRYKPSLSGHTRLTGHRKPDIVGFLARKSACSRQLRQTKYGCPYFAEPQGRTQMGCTDVPCPVLSKNLSLIRPLNHQMLFKAGWNVKM